MLYPTYSVNGVAMADTAKRWHEHESMSVFPAHPGLRATSLSLAGVGGETLLPQAPHEAQDFVLYMVVNAIDATTGKMALTYPSKLNALNANAHALFRTLGIARQTQGTSATIERHMSPWHTHTAYGRLIASSEIEFEPGYDYASYKFIFRIPAGVWHGEPVDELISGIDTQRIVSLAEATAPIDGPSISLAGPFNYLEVTNALGNGFRLDRTLAAGEYVTVDTFHWTVSPTATHNGELPRTVAPGVYAPSPQLHSVGQASAVALTLLPEEELGAQLSFAGSGRVDGQTAARIHTTEAYF